MDLLIGYIPGTRGETGENITVYTSSLGSGEMLRHGGITYCGQVLMKRTYVSMTNRSEKWQEKCTQNFVRNNTMLHNTTYHFIEKVFEMIHFNSSPTVMCSSATERDFKTI
ncbi:hypothetical protein L798_05266 [Zootermopsis nevadensis]|uniref:Uncharacterized protein n=1 Tax=Zootermopsis nevadensis TaxID=136037 RepID=A0A067RI09_ZOONE|nr:hypothetical protein L798_05266 [Zootermopsis nevadensis]